MELMSNPILAFEWTDLLLGLMIAVFLITCLLLIAVILLQKGRGGGISSAFGGGMGSSPFGTKTGDVFTWITVVLAGVFLLSVLFLNTLVVEKKPGTGNPGTDKGTSSTTGQTTTGTGAADTVGSKPIVEQTVPITSQPTSDQDNK
jgi:preprotein translocase subunit SecG